MVRRSKRAAKSDPTNQGDAQSEQVSEEVCSVEHSLQSSEPVEKLTEEVGRSENKTGETNDQRFA